MVGASRSKNGTLRQNRYSVSVGGMRIDELKALYPMLTPEELQEAGENLDQYLLLVWEIWEMREAKAVHVDPPSSEP
jgi:hypothetical protein